MGEFYRDAMEEKAGRVWGIWWMQRKAVICFIARLYLLFTFDDKLVGQVFRALCHPAPILLFSFFLRFLLLRGELEELSNDTGSCLHDVGIRGWFIREGKPFRMQDLSLSLRRSGLAVSVAVIPVVRFCCRHALSLSLPLFLFSSSSCEVITLHDPKRCACDNDRLFCQSVKKLHSQWG
jgi:hypothetical protein